MNHQSIRFEVGGTGRHPLVLPHVTLRTVRYPGLDATIMQRGTFRECHVTARPLPGERPYLWSWRLDSFLREHGVIPVKQDIFGRSQDCQNAVMGMKRMRGDSWPITCVEGAACGDAGIAGVQLVAVGGAAAKTIVVDARPVGSVFTDGWARHCVLGDLRPGDLTATRSTQAMQVYQEMQDALARAGFVLSNLARTWLFINNILGWYQEFNDARTEIFTQRGLFSHVVPASTGVGMVNPHGAALIAGAWAIQPLDGSDVTISEVQSPLQCSARKYGSCFSRAVTIAGSGLERLLISGTASIERGGRSAHTGDIRRQIGLTMDVVEAILRSRGMHWTDVSRATAYFKDPADSPRFGEWCVTHDVVLPALLVQADICREELLFEIEIDALATKEEST